MKNKVKPHDYSAGSHHYQNRGYQGYQNNQQRVNRYGGQNQTMGSAAQDGGGDGQYQNQQQNFQYKARNNRNNNQGYNQNSQSSQGQRPSMPQKPNQASQHGQGGGSRQIKSMQGQRPQYRNNQSGQQYPNQKRQNNNYRNKNQQQQQQQVDSTQMQANTQPIISASDFPGMPVNAMPQNQMAGMRQPQTQPAMTVPQGSMGAPPQQPPAITQQIQVSNEQLQAIGDLQAQKNYLGNMIYETYKMYDEQRAARVVGMILDAYDIEKLLRCVNEMPFGQDTWQKAYTTLLQSEAQQNMQAPADGTTQ